MKLFYLTALAFILFACKAKEISYNYPNNPDYIRNSRPGALFSKNGDLVIFNQTKQNLEIKNTDSALWRSSLQVLQEIVKVDFIDEKNGVIISDWQKRKNDRIRIKLIIKDKKIAPKSLQVIILSYINDSEIDKTHENEGLAAMIKEKILRRGGFQTRPLQ